MIIILLTQFIVLTIDRQINSISLIGDCVPDQVTAIKIAKARLLSIYGKDVYNKPFIAELKNDSVWIVRGIKRYRNSKGRPPFLEINKSDCKILKLVLSK